MSKNISEDRTRRERITKEQKEQIIKLLKESNETQESIASITGTNQSTVSRIKRKYRIGKWTKFSLEECLEKAKITTPSVFFMQVPELYRQALEDNLLNQFRDTDTQYGILHIEQTINPSGLLIYTLDHNFLHIVNELGCAIQI